MSALVGEGGFARLVDHETVRAAECVVELRRGRLRRPLRMRLRLTPWWPGPRAQTLVELLPVAGVMPTAGYYAAGHRLLDELIDGWRERPHPPSPHAAAPAISEHGGAGAGGRRPPDRFRRGRRWGPGRAG